MSALDDFVMGTSPQIDEQMCANARIGYDRVWRAAAEMLHVLRPGGRIYMSYGELADRMGVHVRTARTAVYVLEESGVLRYVDKKIERGDPYETVTRVPAWTPSVGRVLDLDIRKVDVDAEACRERRVGVDRAWRVSVLWQALKTRTASLVATVAGIGQRQVRNALAALGLEVSDRKHSAVRWRLRRKKKRTDPRSKKLPNSSQRDTSYPSSTHAERGQRRRWVQRIIYRGRIMPYDVFDELEDVIPDESTLPTREVTASNVAEQRQSAARSRQDRPVDSWSALDVAKEFQFRVRQAYPTTPGDTGDAVVLAKILGKWRKEYGHDARVEMFALEEWLRDAADIQVRNLHVPLWKKFLKALQRNYRTAEQRVVRSEERNLKDRKAAYVDTDARFHRAAGGPLTDDDVASAAQRDLDIVRALAERFS